MCKTLLIFNDGSSNYCIAENNQNMKHDRRIDERRKLREADLFVQDLIVVIYFYTKRYNVHTHAQL